LAGRFLFADFGPGPASSDPDRSRAFADRQLEEREHDRRMVEAHWRLDHLVRLMETYERWLARSRVHMEHQDVTGTLEGLIRAYPGDPPVLRAWLIAKPSTLDEVERLVRGK
jgi:hypothetical protein